MTEGVVQVKGTRLLFGYQPSSSGSLVIHALACPTGIPGLTAGERPRQDMTCITSMSRQYYDGLQDPPALTIPVNFIPRSESHQAIIAARAEGSDLVMPWLVVFSDQANDPTTIDSDGYLTSPGPTSVGFKGYVSNFTITAAVGAIWTADIAVQLRLDDTDDDLHWDLPTADLP